MERGRVTETELMPSLVHQRGMCIPLSIRPGVCDRFLVANVYVGVKVVAVFRCIKTITVTVGIQNHQLRNHADGGMQE